MNRRQFIVLAALAPVMAAAGGGAPAQRRCQWLRERVRQLDARLRAGYRGVTGRRLRARRRQLAAERFRACR
jgi:hypothetical protein